MTNRSAKIGSNLQVKSQRSKVKGQKCWPRLLAYLLLVEMAQFCGAAQELQLEDVPSTGLNPSVLQNAPLDPARRAILEAAVKSHGYARAETMLMEEINRNPRSPSLLTLLGGIFFLDGKYLDSTIALKKAEAIRSLDDRNRFTLAMAYIILNHRDWARPELEKLAKANPHQARYPYWLSRLDYDEMHFTAAVANVRKALQLDPNFMKGYDNLGLYYEALGKYEEAIRTYGEAIRLNRERQPSSSWPPQNLGTLLVKLDRLDEAEPLLRESLRYDPRFPQAHYQLGLLFERQMKDAEAVQELNQAAALNPSYPEPHYALGRIYRRKGDTKKADAEWNTFHKLKREEPRERPH